MSSFVKFISNNTLSTLSRNYKKLQLDFCKNANWADVCKSKVVKYPDCLRSVDGRYYGSEIIYFSVNVNFNMMHNYPLARMHLGAPATLIEFNNMRFVITYMPDRICIKNYAQDLQKYNTRRLVNVTENRTYPSLGSWGIEMEHLAVPEGQFPSHTQINEWINIVKYHFNYFPDTSLGVYDECGLGRAPTMVAIALIEAGMDAQATINLIRGKRQGAFNNRQTRLLLEYEKKFRLRKLKDDSGLRSSMASQTEDKN